MLGLGAAGIPASVRNCAATPLETARAALALTSAPKSMPCRDQERADIMHFVEDAVSAGESPHPIFLNLGTDTYLHDFAQVRTAGS